MIKTDAEAHDNVVKLFIPVPIQYPVDEGGLRWKTVWQLLDYNIHTDHIAKLYPYVNAPKRKKKAPAVMPEPREAELEGRKYFTSDFIPYPAIMMLKRKVRYFKTGAKRR